jgi:hypothetical protein
MTCHRNLGPSYYPKLIFFTSQAWIGVGISMLITMDAAAVLA